MASASPTTLNAPSEFEFFTLGAPFLRFELSNAAALVYEVVSRVEAEPQ